MPPIQLGHLERPAATSRLLMIPSFLASRFLNSTFLSFLEESFSTFLVQEQPPGYNMVRVDVANMEQQAQEAEGAQARSVIVSCPTR